MITLKSLPTSGFEAAARAEKINALTNTIDAHAVVCGIDPHTKAERIAAWISGLKKADWIRICQHAGCGYPSEITISCLIRLYVRRAEALREAQVA